MAQAFRHALIMAAGRGLRLMPLTNDRPKAMAELHGESLIEAGIARIRPEVGNLHITVGYKGAMLAAHVIGLGVNSVFNTEGRGNAWWLYHTLLAGLDEPLLVLTCDNVVQLDLTRIAAEYRALGRPAAMLVPVVPVPGVAGDFIFHESGRVTALSRQRTSPIYASGIQVLNPAAINAMTRPTDDFYDVWNQLIGPRQLCCSRVYPKRWLAIDTPEQLAAARCVTQQE
jgi:NDP-sugar pyrophosphorylase family protein